MKTIKINIKHKKVILKNTCWRIPLSRSSVTSLRAATARQHLLAESAEAGHDVRACMLARKTACRAQQVSWTLGNGRERWQHARVTRSGFSQLWTVRDRSLSIHTILESVLNGCARFSFVFSSTWLALPWAESLMSFASLTRDPRVSRLRWSRDQQNLVFTIVSGPLKH